MSIYTQIESKKIQTSSGGCWLTAGGCKWWLQVVVDG